MASVSSDMIIFFFTVKDIVCRTTPDLPPTQEQDPQSKHDRCRRCKSQDLAHQRETITCLKSQKLG